MRGFVKDTEGKPTPAYLSVFDLYNKKRVLSAKPEKDGSFSFYLIEGSAYEVSIDHELGTYTYFSKEYDLMHNEVLRNDKVNVTLKVIAPGDELMLPGLRFIPHTLELDNNAESELRKTYPTNEKTHRLILSCRYYYKDILRILFKHRPTLQKLLLIQPMLCFKKLIRSGSFPHRTALWLKHAITTIEHKKKRMLLLTSWPLQALIPAG